jgi:calcineurin-like phosphoesterase family protein
MPAIPAASANVGQCRVFSLACLTLGCILGLVLIRQAQIGEYNDAAFGSDFSLGKPDNVAAYRNRLACETVHFIDGNHDKTTQKLQHLFSSWSSLAKIHVGNRGIVLCHYAMKVWPNHSRGAWQIYGYSDGNLSDDPISLSKDVEVDSHDIRPWHFEEVQALMKIKPEAKAKHI